VDLDSAHSNLWKAREIFHGNEKNFFFYRPMLSGREIFVCRNFLCNPRTKIKSELNTSKRRQWKSSILRHNDVEVRTITRRATMQYFRTSLDFICTVRWATILVLVNTCLNFEYTILPGTCYHVKNGKIIRSLRELKIYMRQIFTFWIMLFIFGGSTLIRFPCWILFKWETFVNK
jgi:hypothetical protein